MITTNNCNRPLLAGFLTNQLDIDERLELFAHLETCTRCWEEVYNARKAEHPHYYKRTARQVKISALELKRLDTPVREDEEQSEYQVA